MARQKGYFEDHVELFPEKFRPSLDARLAYKYTLESDERLNVPPKIWLAFLTPPEPRVEPLLGEARREVWQLKKKVLETFAHPKLFLDMRDPLHRSSEHITLAMLEILYDLKEEKILFPQERYGEWLEIANHFGLWKLRYALEDAVFKAFDPENFALFESVVEKQMFVDAHLVLAIRAIVKDAFTCAGVGECTIENRKKNIYGVYKKVQLKRTSINEIFDIHGFRVLAASKEGCYRAVETLHRLWPHFPERYKDYIARPKDNGYQSIHTVVCCLEKKAVEFQIRTREMDAIATSGPANHAEYKKARSGSARAAF